MSAFHSLRPLGWSLRFRPIADIGYAVTLCTMAYTDKTSRWWAAVATIGAIATLFVAFLAYIAWLVRDW